MQEHSIVSDPSEELILVDGNDRQVGTLSKLDCHRLGGVRHRAFSIHILDRQGRLLLQRRGEDKLLWPGYWSNSCCSHPRAGESMEQATRRRLREELGLECDLVFLYKFEYQAGFRDVGSEFELCSVYLGRTDAPCVPNRNEIAAVQYLAPSQVDALIAGEPESVTPWFAMEWRRIKTDFAELLHA